MGWKLGLILTFFILAVYLFVASHSLPPTIFQPLGGDAYLRIVSVLLSIASIGWLGAIAVAWWQRRRTRHEQVHDDSVIGALADESTATRGEKIVPWFAVLTVVYAVAVFTVGYFVSTFAFLLGSMVMLVDKWKPHLLRLILLSVGIIVALLLLFRAVRFYVPDAWLF